MAIQFNADEIFELAEHIERNGTAFYRAAAAQQPPARALLLTLAEQEDRHLAVFTALRRKIEPRATEPVTYDPDDQSALYLQAMADRRVFNVDQDPQALLGKKASLAHILGVAARLEKDSIVFYAGMKALVPPEFGQAQLDAIIREEWKHLAFLGQLSADLRPGS